MKNLKIGDKVELLREELLDDHYYNSQRTKVTKGTIMEIVAITPKVRMIKGEGCDGKPYFLNLIIQGKDQHSPRVRTNFCNVRAVKT